MANFLNINGLNIHYKWINHQKETTFVFINSLGTDFRIWDKVVEGLVDVANVLCYDNVGMDYRKRQLLHMVCKAIMKT
jgi:pimeloyl-ACP methyl ester carboxylesterase